MNKRRRMTAIRKWKRLKKSEGWNMDKENEKGKLEEDI
jgi:hypothetical protein